MSNTSGALGFVEGLMGGMERREDYERNKRIDKMLDQKSQAALNADVGAYETHLNEDGDPMNWVFQEETEDPFLVRQFGKLKNWITGTEPEEKTDPYQSARDAYANRDVAEGSQSPVKDALPGKLVTYADGGRIPPRRAIDPMEDEDEELAPQSATSGKQHFSRSRAIGGEVRAENERLAPQEGDSAYTRGSKWMDRRKNDIKGFLGGTIAFGRDLVDLAVPDAAAESVQGALGYTDHPDYQPSRATPAPASTPAETAIPAPAAETPNAQAVQAAVGGTPSDAQIAGEATKTAVEATPGHPSNPNQQFDFGAMAKEGFKSEDIAHVPLKDWNEYRSNYIRAMNKQGVSPAEANKQVDEIQYSGFMRNFQQAAYLMMAGDEAGAALAARSAYQYFPNGTDIRFKAMTGKDGNDYLVAAGFDEETGEMRGEPQVMTPEYVNAMLANFSDPKAFNAWKGDQGEAYRLEREWQEKTKPMAQAELDLKGAQADYYRSGAQKNRADSTGGTGGLTAANKMQAHDRFVESVDMLSLEDPQAARQLTSVMERIYSETGAEVGVIINEVQKLYEAGGPEALNALVAEWTSE